MQNITSSADIIDVRDIIAQVEEHRSAGVTAEDFDNIEDPTDDQEELYNLESLLADLVGMGGDEQWEGEWYPVTLIRDSYFETYARELAEDIGAISDDAKWPCTCIDWEKAAGELQMDYSTVEFDGITYWTR